MINEVRIGNWVRRVYGHASLDVKTHGIIDEPFQITRGTFNLGEDYGDIWKELSPLKITAENSEGFNLTKLKNIISLLQIVRSAPLVVPQEFYLVMELQSKAALKIEYVHQLQNLYLDITGEYLEWTPEKKRSKLTAV